MNKESSGHKQQVGRQIETSASERVLVSVLTGNDRTFVHLSVPIAAKEILLELKSCELAQNNFPTTVHILEKILALSTLWVTL